MKNKELYYPTRGYHLIDEGIYKGIRYYIISYGMHPCAYIENIWKFKDYDDSRLDNICVHGGFTFLGRREFTHCLGWDYGHYGDYYEDPFGKPSCADILRRWTYEDILEEIKDVINQMIKEFGKGEVKK